MKMKTYLNLQSTKESIQKVGIEATAYKGQDFYRSNLKYPKRSSFKLHLEQAYRS